MDAVHRPLVQGERVVRICLEDGVVVLERLLEPAELSEHDAAIVTRRLVAESDRLAVGGNGLLDPANRLGFVSFLVVGPPIAEVQALHIMQLAVGGFERNGAADFVQRLGIATEAGEAERTVAEST